MVGLFKYIEIIQDGSLLRVLDLLAPATHCSVCAMPTSLHFYSFSVIGTMSTIQACVIAKLLHSYQHVWPL